jgi:CDP-2,3-bis-(O-geranylgeranyl)-sn-glycerol synthase
MLKILLQIIWFFLPAIMSNMSPIIFRKIPLLNYPVDFNIQFKGKPLFGKNKTYRGFFFGIIIAILTIFIQKTLYPYPNNFSLINYNEINIYLLGFLLGFGALFGDILESFFKRRFNIKSGKPWIPFDQIDWIIGAILLSSLYLNLSLRINILSIIFLGLFHPLVNIISYELKLRDDKI